MNKIHIIIVVFVITAISACTSQVPDAPVATNNPKNIVLIIADGMGMAELYAGYTANGGHMHIDKADHVGVSKTYSANDYITDSAAGGTAISCGQKTNNGVVGINATGDTLITVLELAEKKGLATGLISTSKITHATPASFIAHVTSRGEYKAIAADFLKTDIDLFIGGGSEDFEDRPDGRNLIAELQQKGYSVTRSIDSALNVNTLPMAAFTAVGHNPKFANGRGDMLPNATKHALQLLGTNATGFFLMVEASQIDWAGHDNDAQYLIDEVLDMDKTLGMALEFAKNNPETLVILTADHETGGMTITGGNMENKEVQAVFSTDHHTAVPVPVFAFGPGSELFSGVYENTELFNKMVGLLKLD